MRFDYHTPITVTQLARLMSCPRHAAEKACASLQPLSGGKYPLQAGITAVQGARAPVLDAQYERARKDKESADKLSLENAATRGELAPVSEMKEVLSACISGFTAVLRRRRDLPESAKAELMEQISTALKRVAKS